MLDNICLVPENAWIDVVCQTFIEKEFWVQTIKTASPRIFALIAGIPIGIWLWHRRVLKYHKIIFNNAKSALVREIRKNENLVEKYLSDIDEGQILLSFGYSVSALEIFVLRPEIGGFLTEDQIVKLTEYSFSSHEVIKAEQYFRTGLQLHLASPEKGGVFSNIEFSSSIMRPHLQNAQKSGRELLDVFM